MCHLNASVLIKGIPGTTFEFIVLRKESALDIIAVKTVTNFPAAFDQLDHLHSCYKNVRTVSIQKVRLTTKNFNLLYIFYFISYLLHLIIYRVDQVLE